jgi:hypothetical protein
MSLSIVLMTCREKNACFALPGAGTTIRELKIDVACLSFDDRDKAPAPSGKPQIANAINQP